MFLVGSDDGVYRVPGSDPSAEPRQVLDAGRVKRLRRLDDFPGAFAATETGLYHSRDGEEWTGLGVPEENVYSVGTDPSGERLYAGTRPAHVYVTEKTGDPIGGGNVWCDLEDFQELPSREEWRLPRHDDLAQVRDVLADPGGSNRVVAGVEVGGVHVSDDGGETWEERSDGVHDDVHELHVADSGEYVAATGRGLYVTGDAGRSWNRLDGAVRQRYFRRAFSTGGTVYAAGALANSSTWNDDDADPELFAVREASLDALPLPNPDETVTGMTAVDGALVVATHRGSLFRREGDDWIAVGQFPVPGDVTGRYTPIAPDIDW